MPMSWAQTMRFTCHLARRLVDGDLGNLRDIGFRVDAAGDAQAPAAGADRLFPPEPFSRSLEDRAHSGIRGVVQTKLQRIDLCPGSHDVDLRLAGEYVYRSSRGTPGAGGKRMRRRAAPHPLAKDPDDVVGHVIKLLGTSGSGSIDVVIPQADLAVAVDARLDLDYGRRPVGIVEKLLRAAPGDLHGFAGDLGQPGRLDGLLRRILAAESAAHKRRDDPDILRGETDAPGQSAAGSETAIGWKSRPWPCRLRFWPGRYGFRSAHARHRRCSTSHRRALPQPFPRRPGLPGQRSPGPGERVLRMLVEYRDIVDVGVGIVEFRLDAAQSLFGFLRVRMEHGDQTILVDDGYAGNFRGRRCVDAL